MFLFLCFYSTISSINEKVANEASMQSDIPKIGNKKAEALNNFNHHIFSPKFEDGTFIELNLLVLDPINDFTAQNGNKIFHNPAKPVSCPSGYTCDADSSFLWVCDNGVCNSYADFQTNFKPEFNLNGLTLKSEANNAHRSVINVKCDPEMSLEEIQYQSADVLDGVVTLNVASGATCPKEYDSAVEKEFVFKQLDHEVTLDMKKQTYNKQQEIISLNNGKTVYFNPTAPITCPKGICIDRPSYGWICDANSCTAIAFEDEIPNYGIFQKIITDGVTINYRGEGNIQLSATFQCSNNVNPHTMMYKENSIVYDEENEHISLNIYSSDVCNVLWNFGDFGDATVPSKKERPSPIVYQENETHSIELEVSKVLVFSESIEMTSSFGTKKDVSIILTPFGNVTCPINGACVYSNYSDGFICIRKEKCLPIIYTMSDLQSSIIGSKKDMRGLNIVAPGVGYIKTRIMANCGESKATEIMYDEAGEVIVKMSTLDACPEDYHLPPPLPPPKPTPSAPVEVPEIKVHYNGRDVVYDDKVYAYGKVTLKEENKANQKAEFRVKPGALIECPKNANCLNWTHSNIWKCWSSPEDPMLCVSTGTMEWGVDIQGNNVTYKNGYNGYTTKVTGICNPNPESVHNSYILSEGKESNGIVELTLHSQIFCDERKPDQEGDSSNQGDESLNSGEVAAIVIFVMIACGSILYLVIGALYIKKTKGYFDIPNRDLWERIFTCSCNKETDRSEYNSMQSIEL